MLNTFNQAGEDQKLRQKIEKKTTPNTVQALF